MKQKYNISKIAKAKELVIQECAVIKAEARRKDNPALQEHDFTLLCEQKYDIGSLKSSIKVGKSALISTLRTPQFFPITPYIDKIADAVMEVLEAKEDQSVVLNFDDRDMFGVRHPEPEIIEADDEEEAEDETDEIDGLLKDDIKLNKTTGKVSLDTQDSIDEDEESL